MESKSEWSTTFDNIKNLHDAAYKSIEAAITLEENEKPLEALNKYKEGIALIDHALNIPVSCPDEPDVTWDKACNLIQKLKRTKSELWIRINCLNEKHKTESCVSTSKENEQFAPITYNDLAIALRDLDVRDLSNADTSIIYVNNEAKLYYISPDGSVLSSSHYHELTIYGTDGDVPNIFLQVGNWVYPLVPGVSPCYKSETNGFIFPDIHSDVQGSSVGIIVPEEVDEFLYELLSDILHGVIQREQKSPSTVSQSISSGIVTGAEYLAKGLVVGAENVGRFINYGTPKLINNIVPSTQETTVPRAVSKGLKFTETATNKTAQVTEYVANTIGLATAKLGQFLAPHLQKHGTRILRSGLNYSEEEASSKVEGVLTVAAGTIEGISTVYHGLERSAAILGNNLRDNTVKIVKHKYGSPAGEVTMDTLNTVGNVVVISHTAGTLQPKGLIKRAAKDTGKALVQDYKPK